jgi:hypothetical protein
MKGLGCLGVEVRGIILPVVPKIIHKMTKSGPIKIHSDFLKWLKILKNNFIENK